LTARYIYLYFVWRCCVSTRSTSPLKFPCPKTGRRGRGEKERKEKEEKGKGGK
jgi:hypothetical protein